MVGGAGCAQGGHGIGKAQLRQRHHIHVALGDQGVAHVAQGLAGLKQPVKFPTFAEHRGFRRIEVFGRAFAQDPATKSNAFALDIADREHHPIAEAVVAFLVLTFVLVKNHQAAFHQQGVLVVAKNAGQGAPTLRCVA